MPIEPSRCSDVVGCGAPSVARRRSLETKRCINNKKEESQSDAQSHQGEAVACFYVADWFRLFFLFADVVISRTKTKQKEHKKSLNLDFWHCIGRGKSWSLKSTRRARGVTCFMIYFFPCSASIRSVRQKKKPIFTDECSSFSINWHSKISLVCFIFSCFDSHCGLYATIEFAFIWVCARR